MSAQDQELGALSACVDHIESLPSQDARERVCEYLSARFKSRAEIASRFAPTGGASRGANGEGQVGKAI